MSNALSIIKATYDARSKVATELRSIDEGADGRAYTDDEAKKVTELRSTLEGLDGRVQEQLKTEIRAAATTDAASNMMNLMFNRETGEAVDTRSMGQKFAQDEELRSWVDRGSRGTSPAVDFSGIELRAVANFTNSQVNNTAGNGGVLYQNERLGRIGHDFIDRKVYLADLIPTIQVSTGSIEYVQDVSPLADFANAGVEVTEGAVKPQAGLTFNVITEAAAVVAAWVNLTRQVAADSPQLKSYIEGRLMYTLKRRVDAQLINGNGTAPNLRGLLNRTGINTYAAVTAEQRAVSIRKAVTIMENVETVPEIIVLNPTDAEIFDLVNANSAGIHTTTDFDGGFKQPPSRTAWGMQQVHSTAIAAGTALLIDPMAVALLDRMGMQMFMTDSHASNFTSNILTLLAEVRVGIALFEPKGVTAVTFGATGN